MVPSSICKYVRMCVRILWRDLRRVILFFKTISIYGVIWSNPKVRTYIRTLRIRIVLIHISVMTTLIPKTFFWQLLFMTLWNIKMSSFQKILYATEPYYTILYIQILDQWNYKITFCSRKRRRPIFIFWDIWISRLLKKYHT